MLLLTATLPYARPSPSVIDGMGKRSLIWGTLATLCVLVAAQLPRAWIAAGAVLIVTFCFGLYSRHRIAGITGDVLGANLQLSESAALIAFLWS
jgi:cobalamin synthase